MSVAPSKVYRYFAVDADHTITGDVIEVSPDQVSWTDAVWVTDGTKLTALNAAAAAADCGLPPAGLTRYWARILTGPSDYPLTANATNTAYLRLIDSPEVPILEVKFYVKL